jgi:hypothetical protein
MREISTLQNKRLKMKWKSIKNKPPFKKRVILRLEYLDGEIKYAVAYRQREVEGDRRKVEWSISCAEHLILRDFDKTVITHWADPLDIIFPQKINNKKEVVVDRYELMDFYD